MLYNHFNEIRLVYLNALIAFQICSVMGEIWLHIAILLIYVIMLKFFQKIIFMPPLKTGAYCFATVGRSVGMSVCRSVDLVLSGQYPLTPSLDQYQTWCRGCPQ